MKTSRLTILVMGVASLVVTIVGMEPVFAVVGCNSLKEFAPGLVAKSPGDAKDFAPGQEAEQHCIGCVKELAPGQEGLDLGIIGPPKKIQ